MTRDLKADNNYHVFIDDNHQKFAIGTKMDVETNPDILDLSQVTSCRMDVEQDRTEEQYRDQNGEMRDYVLQDTNILTNINDDRYQQPLV